MSKIISGLSYQSSSYPIFQFTQKVSCKCRTRCATKKCPCKKQGSMCGHYCHPGKSCSNKFLETDNAEVVKLSNVNDENDTKKGEHIWTNVGRTVLTQSDKIAVALGHWLNDKHLYAAQQLLQKQHPHIGGLEDTMLQPIGLFTVQGSREFVQCLNIGSNHWITISTYGCPPSVVRIYDSLHYPISLSVKKTIADLLHTKEEVIVIEVMNVQLQKGGDDCGLFAITMATTLCNGGNPVDMEYDQ